MHPVSCLPDPPWEKARAEGRIARFERERVLRTSLEEAIVECMYGKTMSSMARILDSVSNSVVPPCPIDGDSLARNHPEPGEWQGRRMQVY